MEKTYTISQISKLLGLTNDAIRFYEKKGLVHPTTNPQFPLVKDMNPLYQSTFPINR